MNNVVANQGSQMFSDTLEDFLLRPFYDLGRFITGMVTKPPPTRILVEVKLAATREILTNTGCNLSRCTVENLHTFSVDMNPGQLFGMSSLIGQAGPLRQPFRFSQPFPGHGSSPRAFTTESIMIFIANCDHQTKHGYRTWPDRE